VNGEQRAAGMQRRLMKKKFIGRALSAIRSALCLLGASLLAVSFSAEAQQQPTKVARIGFLLASSPSYYAARIETFRQGLRELGYVEGRNIAIDYRFAEGKRDRLPGLAAELVRLKVEVIVAGDSDTIRFAAHATRSIPIVMTVSSDPVGVGYVASLARPGGNITGLSNVSVNLAGKRLELLKEVAPKLSRVAVLGPPRHPDWTELINAAATMGIKLQTLKVRDSTELEGAFELARRERAAGLIVLPSPRTNSYRRQIVALAAKSRLPAMYP
jgi:putative tryptophan/tyrosine transport system substrate-binding protein